MVLSLRDRAVRQLTSDGSNEDPSWAPDGRHVVFTSTRSGTHQLWVMDIETGRLRQLTRASGSRLADWSPILAPQQELQASNGASRDE
jgi:TolB protein